MTRMNRKDRVLLEGLNSKYGNDLMANAIIAITNGRENGQDEQSPRPVSGDVDDTRECAVLDLVRFLEGARIRFRELHWEAEKNSEHKLTDDIISSLESYEDEIAEDFMGIIGYRIKVGQLIPLMPKSTTTSGCIEETLQWCREVKRLLSSEGGESYDGIVNILDDIHHYLKKAKYLSTMS